MISCGVVCYEKQLARDEAETCPLYRHKGYMAKWLWSSERWWRRRPGAKIGR